MLDAHRVTAAPVSVPAAITLTNVRKRFGTGAREVVALDGISLKAQPGEFVCVVGASGCGKSTLLSLIAGLDEPTAGTVRTAGRVALMFQDAALLPWRTALGNVELALAVRGTPRGERRARARHLLDVVRLASSSIGDRTNCRGACASESPWPGRWLRVPRSC